MDAAADSNAGSDAGDAAEDGDAWAGCESDPFDSTPGCIDERDSCPPERPFCCLVPLGGPEVDVGGCAVSPTGAPEVCNLVATPGCPAHPGCSVDRDRDGFFSRECGGDDCDDADSLVSPLAPDDLEPGRWTQAPPLAGDNRWLARDSLAIDSAGRLGLAILHVIQTDVEERLEWASLDGEAWQVITLDVGGQVSAPAAASSRSGDVYVAYGWSPLAGDPGPGETRAAIHQADSWSIETIDDGCCAGEVALAIDPAGGAFAAYGGYGQLSVASRTADGWSRDLAWEGDLDFFAPPSLAAAAGPAGVLQLAFNAGGDVLTGSNRTGEWVVDDVDSYLRAGSVALAIDAAGIAHLAYQRWSTGDLAYSTNSDGTWQTQIIARHRVPSPDLPYPVAVGDSPAIATGLDNLVAIVANATTGPVLSWKSTADWATERVAESALTTSIAIDQAGAIHVAYSILDGDIIVASNMDLRRVDQNCDAVDGVDADGDGWASEASGGEDCDDTLRSVNPGALEVKNDGIDQDCDGRDAR